MIGIPTHPPDDMSKQWEYSYIGRPGRGAAPIHLAEARS